jgi:hypothetical protein
MTTFYFDCRRHVEYKNLHLPSHFCGPIVDNELSAIINNALVISAHSSRPFEFTVPADVDLAKETIDELQEMHGYVFSQKQRGKGVVTYIFESRTASQ